jgi:hypothetical protein
MDTLTAHIHDALTQVRELRRNILAKQRFKGYSGRARILSGSFALAAAAVIQSLPPSKHTVLYSWFTVLALGLVVNYSALLYWFLFDPEACRDVAKLKPVLRALPALAVGGVLTLAMLRSRTFWPLYGIWMTLFGLANLSGENVLPRRILYVGLFYIGCGTVYLLSPFPSFLNPWPMGIVFFTGEWVAGLVMHFDREEARP